DRNYQNSLVSLPLDNYPAGIYLVKIYHDNVVISRKVLLEK
ncbi:MAG: T9SS type A sorting domain-containing protein, partial [Bacteroidales bacterium]|nr:T9SS type A sorting domain-containing protein [Bacteroidales bacterium]